ncbi:hypothetical protein KPLM21_740109 [Klebsiella pneumoniae]|nr:hypothetical protein KPLM21_740109 [Klebsiella pneumoniae]
MKYSIVTVYVLLEDKHKTHTCTSTHPKAFHFNMSATCDMALFDATTPKMISNLYHTD